MAFNKVDRLMGNLLPEKCLASFPDGLPISATEGTGLKALLEQIEAVLSEELVYLSVQVPYERGDLAALFYDQGTAVRTEHGHEGTLLAGYLPRRWVDRFHPFLLGS
jgi:GTP-binding protein HflX